MAWILVRVGEIWLKSSKTRSALMDRLIENLEVSLGGLGKASVFGPRILVETDNVDNALSVISRVFGVVSASPGLLVEPTLEQIEYAALKLVEEKKGTFRVSVNRAWKDFPMKSPEIERVLGARILEVKGDTLQVDLKNPDFVLGVEVREEFAFVFTGSVGGPGGLPYGSQGKVLALFSGGLDSPVASWMVAKRGAEAHHLFINTCCDEYENQVRSVFEDLAKWYPKTSLYVARVPELREEIKSKINEGYRQVVYKIFLYRLGQTLAEQIGAKAVVTGESLGQVSTQTLTNLSTIDMFSSMLVLRPLIGMDKDEIVAISRKIGLYDKSSKTPEMCKLENHSRTNVPVSIVERLLAKIDFDPSKVDFVRLV